MNPEFLTAQPCSIKLAEADHLHRLFKVSIFDWSMGRYKTDVIHHLVRFDSTVAACVTKYISY